jgi:acetyl-CoA carboxylase carboxyl transferase subunit alpha
MDILQKERELLSLIDRLDTIDDHELRASLLKQIDEYKDKKMTEIDAWDRVLLARHPKRPKSIDYINAIFTDFIEFHGDRAFADDRSIIGGIGFLNQVPVTIIAQQKGNNLDENLMRNFAMPHPEGYRKALRLMQQAEKFNRPIITFIDTPGAYPGIGAEERGQGEAIAKNLYEMAGFTVPIISIVIGEGGSGGALALGVANKVIMLENSIYSILSPEGFASILWKDASKASEAASIMKLTSYDLYDFGIIDDIIKEPIGGAHYNPNQVFLNTKTAIIDSLVQIRTLQPLDIKQHRIDKFRKIGFFQRFNYESLGGRS